MDHMMPEMDGIETTAAIRAWEEGQRTAGKYEAGKRIPIVALTANAVSGMREMFLEKDFDDFLAKPIDLSKLDEILGAWIPKEKRQVAIVKEEEKKEEHEINLVIPGVDINHGIATIGGKKDKYLQILVTFCKEAEDRLPIIKGFLDNAALADNTAPADISVLVTHVHGLKSASKIVGAMEVSAMAANLENAGREGNTDFINKNLGVFVERLTELIENIHKAVDR
jgi:CheY-like chemotaxis protein